MTKLWLRVSIFSFIVAVVILTLMISFPDTLKPMINAGLPLNYFSQLPLLGDAIRAAESPQITVQELKQLIDGKSHKFLLVDVRNPEEYYNAHIQGAILVSLSDIEDGSGITKIKSLLKGQKLITYCAVGHRSHKALELLRGASIFGTNLQGGIKVWRKEIEPSMPEL
jgi:sulfur-carrier protein adenylyltransferase/sulfurtransferase